LIGLINNNRSSILRILPKVVKPFLFFRLLTGNAAKARFRMNCPAAGSGPKVTRNSDYQLRKRRGTFGLSPFGGGPSWLSQKRDLNSTQGQNHFDGIFGTAIIKRDVMDVAVAAASAREGGAGA
jgi:hypothetical protein